MFVAFIDDSGSHQDSAAYVLSAFYTTPKHWRKIMREWHGMVHRYGVNRFHAVDCEQGQREFKGWSRARRRRVFHNLIGILTRHSNLTGFSAAVVKSDYKKVVYPDADRIFGGPAQLAFQLLVLDIATQAKGPVYFVIDKNNEWSAFSDIFQKTKAEALAKQRPWAYRLRSLSRGDVRMTPALQTADLLAYETYREHAEREKAKTGARRPLRKSLRRLMAEKSMLRGPYLERQSLLSLIEQCKKDGKF